MGLRTDLQIFIGVGLIQKVTSEQRFEGAEEVSLMAFGASVSAERAARGPKFLVWSVPSECRQEQGGHCDCRGVIQREESR